MGTDQSFLTKNQNQPSI